MKPLITKNPLINLTSYKTIDGKLYDTGIMREYVTKVVNDINGIQVASGIFNDSAVKSTLPVFMASSEPKNLNSLFALSSSSGSMPMVADNQHHDNSLRF